MLSLTAYAIGYTDGIEVTLSGIIPSSCYRVSADDYYPGTRVYIIDPGFAQVFVNVAHDPFAEFCADVLVPWSRTIRLPDLVHARVQVYLNDKLEQTIKVVDVNEYFIVAQLTGGFVPNGGYYIRPLAAPLLPIYSQVFGPASFDECDRWITMHADKKTKGYDPLALGFRDSSGGGGGSEAPRGLLPFTDQELLKVKPTPRVDLFYHGGEVPRG